MKKTYSLKSKKDFNLVIEKGRKYKHENFTIFFIEQNELLIGISVPKKLGNAVYRNKQKRRVKNILATFLSKNFSGKIVIIIKEGFAKTTFEKNTSLLEDFFEKFRINK